MKNITQGFNILSQKKLTREEKNKQKEEKKRQKLEKLKSAQISVSSQPTENNNPIIRKLPNNSLEPKILNNVTTTQSPIHSQNPDDYLSLTVEFYLTHKDVNDSWSWGLDRAQLDSDFTDIIKPYLEHPKNTKWGKLMGERYGRKNKTKHHHMYVTGIQEEVQDRWKYLELEHPELFTFRMSGKERIWGYRNFNKFFIVWWDPKHQLIPM